MSRDVAIVIGTVVGGYFGEPGLGYAIGSLVGNAYDPVQIGKQGPRLNDLKVQVSDYGKMVPKLHGASRFAGNVIWSTDIIETQHTETSGGKGGGPEVTSTTYTYSQSFAVALCEGEVAGIGKIWANGKLIYNISANATVTDAATSRKIAGAIRFYSGSETQIADSLIEAHIGAGNTPAYRGTAYVVFEDMQLASYGNRTPNMEFETIELGTISHPEGETTTYAIGSTNTIGIAFDDLTNSIWACNYAGNTISKIDAITGNITASYSVMAHPLCAVFYKSGESIFVGNYGSSKVSKINIFTGAVSTYSTSGSGPTGIAVSKNYLWVGYASGSVISRFDLTTMLREDFPVAPLAYGVAYDYITGSIWVSSYGVISRISDASGSAVEYSSDIITTNPVGIVFDPITQSIWAANPGGNAINKINIHDGSVVTYQTLPTPYGVTFDSQTESVWVTSSIANGGISRIDIHTGARVDYTHAPALAFPYGIAFSSTTSAVWVGGYAGSGVIAKVNVEDYGLTATQKSLSDIASDICVRAGLTAAQIDVAQLTDTITGYVVQRSTARAQIEQLMQAFYFDAVESDGKVKFVKRGGAAALTISEDDVAAHLAGGQFPDNLTIERRQELELPVEINVQYMDIDTAYQVNSQRSQRLITDSSNKLALNFAISMDGSKAKQVSDVLMYDSWTARTSFSMQSGWKYSYLEPTDVIGVSKGALTYNVRLVDEDAASGVYARNAVLDDASVYTQSATAAPPLSPTTTVDAVAIINLMLMDIPLLRDQDDAVGFYAAACKYSGSWTGEQTFKSNDGGTSWSQSGRAILNEATIGSASTALGNFTGGNIFDELSSVTVVMINGTLSGTTELAVLNGANVILIGDEVLQFKNAALVSTGVYTLTGLLRGRRGSEWAMSTHAIGDRAVLLSTTTTYLFESSSAEYNLARQYRGVALGGFLDDASSISFTNTGVAQECYSPVHLGGGRNAANDVMLQWTRRTRIGGAWNNYADVPLGEAAEAYVVEIYSSSAYTTLLRTISGITAQNTTYTVAQQTTDGLTPGNTVYWVAYQVSATVGNGYGARGAT